MREYFKSDDFILEGFGDIVSEEIAKIANKKIKNLIDNCTTMFIRNGNVDTASSIQTDLDTHIAKILIMEEIVKKECKHEPRLMRIDRDTLYADNQPVPREYYEWKCFHCGIELTATWSKKE